MLVMMVYLEYVMCSWSNPFFNGKDDWSKIREICFNTVCVTFFSFIDYDTLFKWKGNIFSFLIWSFILLIYFSITGVACFNGNLDNIFFSLSFQIVANGNVLLFHSCSYAFLKEELFPLLFSHRCWCFTKSNQLI